MTRIRRFILRLLGLNTVRAELNELHSRHAQAVGMSNQVRTDLSARVERLEIMAADRDRATKELVAFQAALQDAVRPVRLDIAGIRSASVRGSMTLTSSPAAC